MPEYVAALPNSTDDQVRAATPRRSTEAHVRQDVLDAWHKPGGDKHAQHLVPYRLDGERVTPLDMRVRRIIDVRVGV